MTMLNNIFGSKDAQASPENGHAEPADAKVKELLKSNWSAIERVLINVLLPLAGKALKDDKTFSDAVGKAHELLPLPVRLLIPRDIVIRYALDNRKPLLSRIEEVKAIRKEDESTGADTVVKKTRRGLFSFSLSQEFLQKAVQKEFPATFDHFMGTPTLSNPVVSIEKDSARVGIELDVAAQIPLLGQKTGSVRLTGEIVMPEGSVQLFVGEPQISRLKIDGVSEGKTDFLMKLVQPALVQVLKRAPVYEIPPGIKARVIKDVYVKDGKLRVALGL